MRFWRSQIHGGLRGGRYFITSEDDCRRTTRFFSIREAMPDGDIRTVSKFQEFRTLEAARDAVSDLLHSEKAAR